MWMYQCSSPESPEDDIKSVMQVLKSIVFFVKKCGSICIFALHVALNASQKRVDSVWWILCPIGSPGLCYKTA